MTKLLDDQTKVELDVLERYGLRWAVLASWRDDLSRRRVNIPPGVEKILEASRIKIASGCFSTCEVGCDLSSAEKDLVSADSSSGKESVDFWLELLGRSMSETADTQKLLGIPSIKTHFQGCHLAGCKCEE